MFGRRLLHGQPDLYPVTSRLHCMRHRSDKVALLMKGMLDADPRLGYIELWEMKGDGLRLSMREGGAQVPTEPEKRPFIRFEADLRASKAKNGFITLFNGKRTQVLNSQPGSYNVEEELRGVSFGKSGCWIPLGTMAGDKMEVTHVLAVYGRIKPKVSRRNRQLRFIVSSARIVDDQIHSQRTAERADSDWVTGLYNRHFFEQRLEEASLDSIVRRRSISIAFIDLDHLKSLNDTYGHRVGDEVLGELGFMLRTRGSGLPMRYGGEEFVVMEFGLSPEIAVEKALDLHRAFSPLSCSTDAGPLKVRASIGVFSSFMWDDLRYVELTEVDCTGMAEDDAKKMRALAKDIVWKVRALNRLRREADAEICKLREFEEVARKHNSSSEFEAMLRSASGPLQDYAKQWGELIVKIADTAMYYVKSTGRDGIASPIVRGSTLAFERLRFRAQDLLRSSIAGADPQQLSLPGRRSYPPSPSEGQNQ